VAVELTGLCRDHSFESATDVCRRCGLEFCELCVVTPFGDKKPLCKECAMAMGGVRSYVSRQAMAPRVLKKRVKAFETSRNKNVAAPIAGPDGPDVVDPTATMEFAADALALEPSGAAAPGEAGTDAPATGIDWSQPFG